LSASTGVLYGKRELLEAMPPVSAVATVPLPYVAWPLSVPWH